MGDIRDRAISASVARRVYKVVFDAKTLKVDEGATAEARAEERKARLKRGQPYAKFEKKWSKMRPSDQALKFFDP